MYYIYYIYIYVYFYIVYIIYAIIYYNIYIYTIGFVFLLFCMGKFWYNGNDLLTHFDSLLTHFDDPN